MMFNKKFKKFKSNYDPFESFHVLFGEEDDDVDDQVGGSGASGSGMGGDIGSAIGGAIGGPFGSLAGRGLGNLMGNIGGPGSPEGGQEGRVFSNIGTGSSDGGLGGGLGGGFGEFGVGEVGFDPGFLLEMLARQEELTREGLALAEGRFDRAEEFQTPFFNDARGFGALTSGVLSDRFSANNPANAFVFNQNDPEFQQLLSSGVGAIDAAASASGLLNSGARLKDLNTFGQGLANTFAGDVLNRRRAVGRDRFTDLSTLSGIEQSAANNISNINTGFGQLGAGLLSGLGSGALDAGKTASSLGLQADIASASNALTAQGMANDRELGLLGLEQNLLALEQDRKNNRGPSSSDKFWGLVGEGIGGYVGGRYG